MGATTSFVFEEGDTALPVRFEQRGTELWFIAADIAKILGYRDALNAVRTLDDDEKGTHIVSTLGGDQALTVISEAGLYRLIFTSRKPVAERFKRWLAHEVLPEIRRTGSYVGLPASRPSRFFDARTVKALMPPRELRVLLALEALANAEGFTTNSPGQVAEMAGVSRETAERAMFLMVVLGLIEAEPGRPLRVPDAAREAPPPAGS